MNYQDTSHHNRINEGMMSSDPLIELPPGGVITTHCVSSVIKPGRNKSQDPLQFVKIESTELCKKVSNISLSSDRLAIDHLPTTLVNFIHYFL